MDHEETGCQAHPEGPILCVNNCGFFGSAATMNMCSKCHKDMMLKQEQEKLAASSIGSFVNGTSSSNGIGSVVSAASVDVKACPEEPKATSSQPGFTFGPEATKTTISQSPFKFGSEFVSETHTGGPLFTVGSGSNGEPKPDGPKRCMTCNKRVGLTGFSCRCGDLFCAVHRYSDKHDCPFDYRTAGRDAIARANPLVKAKKLDKI